MQGADAAVQCDDGGFRGELALPITDGLRDGFGKGALGPGRFEAAGGTEGVEDGPVHGVAGVSVISVIMPDKRNPCDVTSQPGSGLI